ncbi:hypothetical protein FBF31_03950 [Candidatus Saccharibacteria bacterium oral taxon 955]|nr:hypothetical protein FBF33_03940 [Candidatus Saccharibacteria bacterium oral taxon 955]QJU06193.1 hypothetical protein FBF31_03950 [Candidatus Saccharibacteria bacterium oral taxon 955]
MSLKSEKNNQVNHKAVGILIILLVLLAFSTPMLVSLLNDNGTSTNSNTVVGSTSNALAACIDTANSSYTSRWKAADKDGDGQVAYADGASSITTNYYDAMISCYQTNKVSDSESVIADYQQKRQQETDKYNAWVSSQKQPSYRTPVSCVSNTIGSTAYTNCY